MLLKILKLSLVVFVVVTLVVTGACTPAAQYNLTTSVEPAGAGTVSAGGIYDKDTNVRITATPNEGYRFDSWSGDASGTSETQTVIMNSDKNLIAHFTSGEAESTKYTVNISVFPTGAGIVTPAGGTYNAGTILTLTAEPASLYAFTGWQGDASGSNKTITITVDGNKNITAKFAVKMTQAAAKQYTLTTAVSPANGGLVTPSGGSYNTHASTKITAMPADGYKFHHWGGNISGTEATTTITFNNDINLTAFFEEAGPLTLTSPVFTDGGNIPSKYTCDGEDISPALSWIGVPFGTESFVLTVDDPGASFGVFTHWVIYNIPGDAQSLSENIPIQMELTNGTIQGINNFAKNGYGGPCPPRGEKHKYRFTLYAVDFTLELSPYAATQKAVVDAIQGHILSQVQISGYYQN
jgi:Raf kinase inhibitor-like YbhB/YbcL family protein